MISPNFYDKSKAVKLYLNGKIRHYLLKERSVTLKSYPYVVRDGETYYSIALRVFGEEGMRHWTIIGDLNSLRQPEELRAGETIRLPEIILNDPDIRAANYGTSTSSAIPIKY